jgi:hypothetical protein
MVVAKIAVLSAILVGAFVLSGFCEIDGERRN